MSCGAMHVAVRYLSMAWIFRPMTSVAFEALPVLFWVMVVRIPHKMVARFRKKSLSLQEEMIAG